MTSVVSPGPWHTSLTDDCAVVDSRHFDVCEMLGDYEQNSAEMEANARLIAAAPDLLALAKQLASECCGCSGTGLVWQYTADHQPLAEEPCADCADIRAVIAKAEGR